MEHAKRQRGADSRFQPCEALPIPGFKKFRNEAIWPNYRATQLMPTKITKRTVMAQGGTQPHENGVGVLYT
jgi:hypothetical protein